MDRRSLPVSYRLVAGVVVAAVLASVLPASSAGAVTEQQVEDACAESAEAYETYRAERSNFEREAEALEQAGAELDQAQHQEERIRTMHEQRQSQQADLRDRVESEAAELYMQAMAGPTGAFALFGTPEEVLTATSFLAATTGDSRQAINDLSALTGELERLQTELAAAVADLTAKRDEQQAATARQEEAMRAAIDAYDRMSGRCKEMQASYEAEQARLRAQAEERQKREAEERRRAESRSGGPTNPGGDTGGGGTSISGIACPFNRGRTQFIDTWGAPRPGGRSHKGTDMFASMDEPVYAVAAGVVSTRVGGIGGKTVWLVADDGRAYYYAHLNGFAVNEGQRVGQGQLIAYNGNSGNAAGTSPHVHFQIHPSGRSGSPINPYNTVAAACL